MSSNVARIPVRIPAWSFADRIRKVRRDERLTLAEMASAIGVGEKAYGAWESGRNTPANIVDIAVSLERATGVPRTWFLGWNDENAPTPQGEGVEWAPRGSNPRPAD